MTVETLSVSRFTLFFMIGSEWHVCVYIYMWISDYVCKYAYAYICMYMCVCVYIYMYICVTSRSSSAYSLKKGSVIMNRAISAGLDLFTIFSTSTSVLCQYQCISINTKYYIYIYAVVIVCACCVLCVVFCVLSVMCCVLSVVCCVLSVVCCVLSVVCCVLSVVCCVLSVVCRVLCVVCRMLCVLCMLMCVHLYLLSKNTHSRTHIHATTQKTQTITNLWWQLRRLDEEYESDFWAPIFVFVFKCSHEGKLSRWQWNYCFSLYTFRYELTERDASAGNSWKTNWE